MNNIINLESRLSHGYRDGWSSLDEWQTIGTAKVLARRNLRDKGEGSLSWTERVVVSRDTLAAGIETVERAIGSTLSYGGCRHEHDCCGCVSVSAYAEHKGGREFLVRSYSSRNL